MVLKYVLGSALAAVATAHFGSFSSYVPAGLCSGPCPAQSKQALALVQRHASTLPSLDVDVTNEAEDQQNTVMAMQDLEIQKRIEDEQTAMRWIAKSEEKHKEKQEIVKLEKDIAKQKDLVNKHIEDKHKAKQSIVKLEKEVAEQKSEGKDYVQASSLQRSYQEAAQYVLGSTSSNSCPAATIFISSEADCQAAQIALGLTWPSEGASGDYGTHFPTGCLQYHSAVPATGSKVYFNTGAGGPSSSSEIICQQVPVCSNVVAATSSTYPCKCGTTTAAAIQCQAGQVCTATSDTNGVCQAAQYVLGSTCPAAYTFISSEADCQAAQIYVALTWGYSNDWGTAQPKGCLQSTVDSKVFFNTGAGWSKPNNGAVSLCQQAPTTESPTTAAEPASASGDPHLSNIRGDKFDIYQAL